MDLKLIQCHPRWRRYVRHRQPQFILLIFVFFLVIFKFNDRQWFGGPSNVQEPHTSHHGWRDSDVVVALQAQLGYLKNKMAVLGHVNLDVNDHSQPVIYAITPTYAREVQKAELTRLCHTFLLVPNFHWIVVEDARAKTKLVTDFLTKCGVTFSHLFVPTPPDLKIQPDEQNWRRPRGVHQRNEALSWIRDQAPKYTDGVIYFADDDNSYSLDLFDEIRSTRKVSVFPVGLVGGLWVEKPKVSSEGKVIGWDATWAPQRPFALDMAGFAVNLDLFLAKTKTKFAYQVKRGHQESEFLRHLVESLDELEPKADKCTKVLVWHTRTERAKMDMESKRKELGLPPSNLGIEV
eukprot:snap_masked-scaffold541_size141817-processed-gene-0.8 protein:Tk05606 transcript:snap_masked-scaffold541_size141817-processed-gene-0.8-mRNA-1 annotation:"galactosylgalactosylxylosylprotein 3-beta-glucuronosyltransferase i"